MRAAILDGATLLDIPIFERLAPNGERALRRVVQAFVERGSAYGLDTRCVSAYRPPPFVIG